MLTLVHGARRSGKSRVAEDLLRAAARVVYLAPLTATDAELTDRVTKHQQRRPDHWRTIEGRDCARAIAEAAPDEAVLLDSLGTWVSEHLWREEEPDIGALVVAADAHPAPVVVVIEEAGWGPVPPDALTRRWLDLVGDTAQRLSARADRALLVVGGRTLELPG